MVDEANLAVPKAIDAAAVGIASVFVTGQLRESFATYKRFPRDSYPLIVFDCGLMSQVLKAEQAWLSGNDLNHEQTS
ncbi:hypothetical protein ACIPVK_07180 [Paeniglutamicibacter sp. MACA_103]|uniref:hypothetical protein n=1 Tax=Paeniglutamicibacter sp. MACA_103 TaxID=3377337 RepID=UPI0038964A1A